MLVNSIHQSRAAAIIIVTAGHVYGMLFGPELETHFDILVASLINGGTTLFVFISGFLFHRAFYERFQFKRFFANKIRNVLIPYLILSVFPIIIYLRQADALPVQLLGGDLDIILSILRLFATGEHMVAYWFIPFIMMTFLLSPLHYHFVSWRTNFQLTFIVMFLIFSTLIHRPIDNINILQSLVYFTPVYLLGIVASKNYDKLTSYLKGKEVFLLILILAIAFVQTFVDEKSNYHKDALVFDGIDLMIIQKIIFAFFMLSLLHRISLPQFPTDNIANMSFAIYFLHPYFIFMYPSIVNFVDRLLEDLQTLDIPNLLMLCIATTTIVIGCVLSGLLAKQALGRYSRYVIGY